MTDKVNSRDWTFEISDGATTPTWTEIGGINTHTFSRSSEMTDTTDYASDGVEEKRVMQRGKSVTCEGFFLEDASGNRDAGQAAIEVLLADTAVGAASLQDFRVTSPGGTVDTFEASFEASDTGGGNNDMTSWGFTAHRNAGSTIS